MLLLLLCYCYRCEVPGGALLPNTVALLPDSSTYRPPTHLPWTALVLPALTGVLLSTANPIARTSAQTAVIEQA